jgi:hypothetical protein
LYDVAFDTSDAIKGGYMSCQKLLALFFVVIVSGCVANPVGQKQDAMNSPFTHGNVQLNLKKGVTTQAEVLNIFGPPNVATIDADNNEIWTYQKNATITTSTESDSYGTLILFGGSASTTGFEKSSKTMTLIIKFDQTKKVVDFKSMTTSF